MECWVGGAASQLCLEKGYGWGEDSEPRVRGLYEQEKKKKITRLAPDLQCWIHVIPSCQEDLTGQVLLRHPKRLCEPVEEVAYFPTAHMDCLLTP